MPLTPEQRAREHIDELLTQCGWVLQDFAAMNILAAPGIAVREFKLRSRHGKVDYLLYVNGQAVGAVEAKPEGYTLTGVEVQNAKYSTGLPPGTPAPTGSLGFLYESTGEETRFTNRLDPKPRSRAVFAFHRPETLAAWLEAEPLWMPAVDGKPHVLSDRPATLRTRLAALPAVIEKGLWPAQLDAVRRLEDSFARNRPRALIQMATGSGKTFTAVSSIYRLVKEADVGRVLFLVDRANLGRQALKEFQSYRTPDDGRLFTELYNVQRLAGGRIDPVARVCISTIQRLYSLLRGDTMDDEADEQSLGGLEALVKKPQPVVYNPGIPIETFDVVFVDECHRSIYTLWKQVLEYFDAFLVGLTATPSKQTFGFFNRNLVMEYNHERAVADGVNVDFDIYRIRTAITERGSKVESGIYVEKRDRATRKQRWEQLDEDLEYSASDLDKDVVAIDQIRTVATAFKERFLPEVFGERTHVPKTLVFAKDDSHADDIVKVLREVFDQGNDFAQKITYRTTGAKTDDLIQSFRTSYWPRIAVTVDMIATGTDIKPIEVVWFMRAIKSRNLFEQMKGRGVRVIDPNELQGVTPDALHKTRFLIVDCVGVCEQELADTTSLDRQPGVSLQKLLQAVATGNTHPDVISTLASRFARLEKELSSAEQARIAEVSGGASLKQITNELVEALSPDAHVDRARVHFKLGPEAEPSPAQVEKARTAMLRDAAAVLIGKPDLRYLILDLRKTHDQVIDTTSVDEITQAEISKEARDRARVLVASFESFIEEHRNEIIALQLIHGSRDGARLTREAVRDLAARITAPPYQWTTERVWNAYRTLETRRVRGAPLKVLTDLVALVRFALQRDEELQPLPALAEERFANWMAQQENRGRVFSAEQRWWLGEIAKFVSSNVEMTNDDFELAPFAQKGGLGGAYRVFGDELQKVIGEVSGVVAA